MPHKGMTVLDGRLDPSVWGRFPIRNMLAGIDGSMLLHGVGNNVILASDPRFTADNSGALSHDATDGLTLTTGAAGSNYAVLNSSDKVKLAGNRFVIDVSLTTGAAAVADDDAAIFLGFTHAKGNPLQDGELLLVDSTSVVGGSFGLLKKADASELNFSSIADAATATQDDVVTGVDLAASTQAIRLSADGKGRIEVYADGVLKKKTAYPSVAEGYLCLAVVNLAADVTVASFGLQVAFGVAE